MVLPSYREGLPKSLIEAAACARPLITTDVPGCREVVTHGVDGLLVPVRDGEALARAIAHLQDDPELARRLGQAAREKALAEFDERVVIEQTLAPTTKSPASASSSDLYSWQLSPVPKSGRDLQLQNIGRRHSSTSSRPPE